MKVIRYLLPYVLISSFNYYFAKDAILSSSPITFNLIRYLISSVIFVSLSKGKIILNKDVVQLSIYTTFSSLLWALGLKYVTPAESAVLSYSMPLFALPIAFYIISESPTLIEIVGLVVGFSGVILYGLPLVRGFTLIGAILTLVNAVFWALFTVFYRKLRNYDPIRVNASQFSIGSLILALILPLNPQIDPSTDFIEGIVYTSTLGGALSFFLWNMMVKVEKIPKVTVLSFSVPILTTFLEFVIYRVSPYPIQLVGITFMFLGILISRARSIKG
ncbi:EamA/RhaT family transporter [Sulfolobus sp. B1]|uniref:DMT family transporter n=1 Tax=Sulfolobaceae TaxID=118883 RepID=UPI000846065D|nr:MULTISPECIES: DMT family transporter [unclassified Sulfolobus]TRM74905.1 EamA/RhaT family transporter [Sulfolobus sp. A20-N-F8]TRM86289.1 EamA/RhaT family transporter [Sulfolobus sp. C3]TRM98120.1 EamA/RhaT family transporter [Sulfolobus sp. F1]TRN00344.1 EamA/RhaT family transporter [Sulfolobus sp. E1]TRM96835.1 EamA/RhaT family transporter [Sulfolobus sp. B1]